jgi:hypothetical protein
MKAVLSGRSDEIIDLVRVNLPLLTKREGKASG